MPDYTIEVVEKTPVLELKNEQVTIELNAPGPQGPAGPAGPAGAGIVNLNDNLLPLGEYAGQVGFIGYDDPVSADLYEWDGAEWVWRGSTFANLLAMVGAGQVGQVLTMVSSTSGTWADLPNPIVVSETQPVGTEGLLWVQPL